MVSKESLFFLNFANYNAKKDYYKLTKKMLYKKYTFGPFSFKRIFTDYLIFNNKCRLTLFFKEFLISDNSCEYLRNFYRKEDLKNILGKILEIYCLYSKIYPNYIILNENKFLYKNIRKKQKMIDENNNKNNDKNNNNDNINKTYELFTLSVRNEIKEFENSYYNKYNHDNDSDNDKDTNNNNDNNRNSKSNRKKKNINNKIINDDWALINNKNFNQNLNNAKKNNNNKHIKNMSFDSFWTNDTNNLSMLLNAINDKIFIDDNNNNKNKKENKNKNKKNEKDVGYRNINYKILKNKNRQKKENKSISQKTFKKIIYKKIDNKNILSDNSRNNNFLKTKNKKKYLNNLNMNKPLSSSLTNNNKHNTTLVNKGNNIYNHLLTDKNWNKKIKNNMHQYYSLQRDTSDKIIGNNLKKIINPFLIKKKFYSKDFSKEKKSISKNENNNLKKINYKYDTSKYNRKTTPHEFLKIIFDGSKKNILNEKSIKEESVKNGSFNNKIMYSTNNNFNTLRNKKYFIKKYFTNNNMNQRTSNQRYAYTLTESNSQAFINFIKENHFNSNYNDNKYNVNENKIKSLNNCHTSTNYNTLNSKNINNNKNKYFVKRQKTEGTSLPVRDIMLNKGMGTTYIKKKCFSPISNNCNRQNSLSKSYNIKKETKKNNMQKENIINNQFINLEIKNKIINIKKNIIKQYMRHDNHFDNNIYEKTYLSNNSINKINNSNNYLNMDYSQKENNTLNLRESYRNNKKIYLRKNFSPTLTYYNLYKSSNKHLSNSKVNTNANTNANSNKNNNSEFIEFHHDNYFIKNKNNNININNNEINKINKNKELSINLLENKENNLKISNIKDEIKIKKYNMIKSKTEYEYFKPKYKNKNININKKETQKQKNNSINKDIILRKFQKKPNFYIFTKDKINKNNLCEIPFQRFNNLSNSTVYNINNSNNNDLTYTKNISLSNSMKNMSEYQTPLLQKKRLKLIKKFIYHDKKEKSESTLNNMDLNISSKVTIKVNRTKFLQRIKERMKNKNTNQI